MLQGSLAAMLGAPAAATASNEIRVVDMRGREIALPRRPRRIALFDARDALTMAILDPDPMRFVVGWTAPEMIDSDALIASLKAAAGRDIPVIGGRAPGSISIEAVVALKPDAVITTAYVEDSHGGLAERLAAFGIPVLFSDSATPGKGKQDGDRLPALMRMWGTLLGREQRAEAFLAFVEAKLNAVARCVQTEPRRKTYLEVQSTYDECCWAAGTRVWRDLLSQAGGRLPDAVTAPWFQKLHVEQLIVEQPDIYIASGGAFAPGMRPAIAPGLSVPDAQRGLARLVARTGLESLSAVREGRVYGIWTGLITISPFQVLFVEQAAKWLHPQACKALEPDRTLAELNARFLAVPLEGPVWARLGPVEPGTR